MLEMAGAKVSWRQGGCERLIPTLLPSPLLAGIRSRVQGGMSMTRVSFVVVDEADRMFAMGFEEQVGVSPDGEGQNRDPHLRQHEKRTARCRESE